MGLGRGGRGGRTQGPGGNLLGLKLYRKLLLQGDSFLDSESNPNSLKIITYHINICINEQMYLYIYTIVDAPLTSSICRVKT